MNRHTNLLAYNDHEIFTSYDKARHYKAEKLASTKKNIAFIKEHFNKPISVLEIGSGNSKFLYSLHFASMLEKGYGVEISKSRFDFANQWKAEMEICNVTNFNENAITFDLSKIPKVDLIYCVDLALQFFEPVEGKSDIKLLQRYYNHLNPGGKIILELDCHHRLIKNMKDGEFNTTWQEFDEPDPWRYLLWGCRYNKTNKHMRIEKTFIRRDSVEISKSDVILKNYERSDIVDMLKQCKFKNIEVRENWQQVTSDDTLEDEFIVVGAKRS